MKVRIATRGSDLALWQANHVARRLETAGAETELIVLKTRGDLIDDVPLHQIEGKAFFTTEIEAALSDGRADLAVHSHKDLPTEESPGLTIAAVPERAPNAERLLVRSEAHDPGAVLLPLANRARVGTSSPRRAAQLGALRPDLEVIDLRGNVPTRVNRLREGRYDAILLADAGLSRLELDTSDLVSVTLGVEHLVPAPAQGALALQTRADDEATLALCRSVFHDESTAAAVEAERSLLAAAGGGCSLPLGVAVERAGDVWHANVFLGADHPRPGFGSRWATGTAASPQAAVDAAYAKIVAEVPTRGGPLADLRVALCGSSTGKSALGARFESLGAQVEYERVIVFEDLDCPDLTERLQSLADGDVLAVTSRHAVRRLGDLGELSLAAGVRVAAVGQSTAAELDRLGRTADVVGTGGAHELAEGLTLVPGARVLYPCAEGARDDLEGVLAARNVRVDRAVLYRTVPLDDVVPGRDVDVRVFMSPSAVHATLPWEREEPDRRTLRIALGRSTADELARCDLAAVSPSDSGDPALPLSEHLIHFLCRLHAEQETVS